MALNFENEEAKRAFWREQYWKNRENNLQKARRYRAENLEKERARDRVRNKTNPLRMAKGTRKRIPKTLENYARTKELDPQIKDELFRSQGEACAICRKPEEQLSFKSWHIDHCHKSGVVRGILCHHCNSLLGFSKDHPGVLRSAASYLEKGA